MGPMTRPNLVFLFADQLRYQSCGYAGDSHAETPNIDRLAAGSVDFRQAVSVFPVCSPFRMSLLTGQYPSTTGQFNNDLRCMPTPHAIGHVLSSSGYNTGYIGKWHLWESGDSGFVPPGPYRLGFDDTWAAYNCNHHYHRGSYFSGDHPDPIPMNGYQTDAQTDLALDFLRTAGAGKDPFALFVSYEVPHPPPLREQEFPDLLGALPDDLRPSTLPPGRSDPPNAVDPNVVWGESKRTAEWWETLFARKDEMKTMYHLLTTRLDRNLGRILELLESLDLSANTILVFTSDHGEMLYGHGRIQKRIFYEESVRVPFLLRWPERFGSGTVTDVCLNTPDIMPTLLDLMNIPSPAEVEGHSLAGAVDPSHTLATTADGTPAGSFAFLQGMSESSFLAHEEWRGVRDARYTYAKMRADGRELLFDNHVDPHQLEDLSARSEQSDRLEHCRRLLHRCMTSLGDRFESTEWYRRHWTEGRRIVRSEKRNSVPENA